MHVIKKFNGLFAPLQYNYYYYYYYFLLLLLLLLLYLLVYVVYLLLSSSHSSQLTTAHSPQPRFNLNIQWIFLIKEMNNNNQGIMKKRTVKK